MSKKILTRVSLAVIAIILAVLYLLSELLPESFGWFNLSTAISIFSFIAGATLILSGIFGKNASVLKKWKIYIGIALIIVCIITMASAIALPNNLILPIIAIVAAVGLLIAILAVGGKKWDDGDNKKVGYKTYRERKEEEEKNKKNN